MSRDGRTRWSYLLLEASLIVLSVLLGFAISEWRQGQQDQALAQRVLETIRREVEANRDELERALANHEEVLARLGDAAASPTGIRPAVLRNSAWSTAQATGATVQLDYDVTELAAGLHELQDLHRTAQTLAFEQLATIRLNEGRLTDQEARGMRQSTWGSLVGLERKLMEEYERALEIMAGD